MEEQQNSALAKPKQREAGKIAKPPNEELQAISQKVASEVKVENGSGENTAVGMALTLADLQTDEARLAYANRLRQNVPGLIQDFQSIEGDLANAVLKAYRGQSHNDSVS